MYRGAYFTLLFVWLCNSEGKMWAEKNGIEKPSKNFVGAPVPRRNEHSQVLNFSS
jgi:hypothetical protein